MAVVGFSGTRHGLTAAQHAALKAMLEELLPTEARHGCAIGADAEFAAICHMMTPRPYIVGHRSNIKDQTSGIALGMCDHVHPTEPPLKRNVHILAASTLLVACPDSMEERLRSGTWSTIRNARKRGLPVRICWPDGTTTEEGKR